MPLAPMVTPPDTSIVGVTADCEEALLVNATVMTVSALSAIAPEAVKTKTPVLCVQAPALPKLPAAAPPTAKDPELPVSVPVNPLIVMTSPFASAVSGRIVNVIVFEMPCMEVDSAIVLVVMDCAWMRVGRRERRRKRRRMVLAVV